MINENSCFFAHMIVGHCFQKEWKENSPRIYFISLRFRMEHQYGDGDVLNKTKKVLRSSDVEKKQTIFPEFNISFWMFYRELWNGVTFEGVPGTTWL